MKNLHHTGNSANIALYAEPTSRTGDIFAEVLRNDRTRGDCGGVRLPLFVIIIHRIGQGEITRKVYRPRSDPGIGKRKRLPETVVTRLVRQALRDAP